jgi:hypothetical protein
MVRLSRSGLGKLAYDYPGFIAVCKLRYGYGHQEHIEKLEILHNWYSNLLAYLPEMYSTKPDEYNNTFAELVEEVKTEIDAAYVMYDGDFEGQSCNPKEKEFIRALRGIKERLDIITAKSKVIKDIPLDDMQEQFG